MVKAVFMADNPFFYDGDILDYVYGRKRFALIRELVDVHPVKINSDNFNAELPNLKDVEVIFSTWGMLKFTSEQLAMMPKLKVVFYAAGAAHSLLEQFSGKGIIVCSAQKANSIPVAEFCLGQILLACKGYFKNTIECGKGPWLQSKTPTGKGVYGETVAIVGAGEVGRYLLKLLKPFKIRKIAVSDYLEYQPEKVAELGIDKLVSIEEAFREAYVVSNHLPDLDAYTGAIYRKHFESMRRDATFINTGRGSQVNERDLIEVFKKRSDLTALLDVMHPEPPLAGSELFNLPNVQMSSHIAGSVNDEVRRMADCMINDLKRWLNGEPLKFRAGSPARIFNAST